MNRTRKKGFTLVELVVAMVVLTFASLILAVCMQTAWKLRTEAVKWQNAGADLNVSAVSGLGAKAKLTLTGGLANLTASDAVGRAFSLPAGLKVVSAYYPLTMDWSALRESGVQPASASFSGSTDPLALSTPNPPSGGTGTGGSPTFAEGNHVLQKDVPALSLTSLTLTETHTNLVIPQEFWYLSGDLSTSYGKGGVPGTANVIPASGNNQPLLVYVAKNCNVYRIEREVSASAPAWVWTPGWYAVPAGTDLFSAELNADTAQKWRLDYTRYNLTGNDALTDPQRAELQAELDKAYARLILAGVTFGG